MNSTEPAFHTISIRARRALNVTRWLAQSAGALPFTALKLPFTIDAGCCVLVTVEHPSARGMLVLRGAEYLVL